MLTRLLLISLLVFSSVANANQADDFVEATFAGKAPKVEDYPELAKMSHSELQKEIAAAVERYNSKNFKPVHKKKELDSNSTLQSSESAEESSSKEPSASSGSSIGGMPLKVITTKGYFHY